MRSSQRSLLSLIALLVVLAMPAAAQKGSVTPQRTAGGCWRCMLGPNGVGWCEGAGTQGGYWNCTMNAAGCFSSSPGCGGGAMLPVDLDGSPSYVSADAAQHQLALFVDRSVTRRNCDGLIVARRQTAAEVAQVRERTDALTL